MCLAIYKPVGKGIPKAFLERGFAENDDGAGFAVQDAGHIIIEKGFFTFAGFWKAWKQYQEHEAIIHFRWATAGTTGVSNCHPFWVGKHVAFCHNGHFSRLGEKERSDTRVFVEDYLTPLVQEHPGCYRAESIKRILERCMLGSKGIILDRQGAVILHEALGHWKEGIWYSNDSYQEKKPSYMKYLFPVETKEKGEQTWKSLYESSDYHERYDAWWQEEDAEEETTMHVGHEVEIEEDEGIFYLFCYTCQAVIDDWQKKDEA